MCVVSISVCMDHGGAETGDRPPLALHALPNRTPSVGVGVGWDGPKATARSQHFNAGIFECERNLCQPADRLALRLFRGVGQPDLLTCCPHCIGNHLELSEARGGTIAHATRTHAPAPCVAFWLRPHICRAAIGSSVVAFQIDACCNQALDTQRLAHQHVSCHHHAVVYPDWIIHLSVYPKNVHDGHIDTARSSAWSGRQWGLEDR